LPASGALESGVRTRRLFDLLLARRGLSAAAAIAFTLLLGALAARVRMDASIEAMFPLWDPVRRAYDHYKDRFPYDDARALVIAERPDLFTPAGLAGVQALEDELRAVTHVADVEGPLSMSDVGGDEDTIRLEKIFPAPDLAADDIARRAAKARSDPLFAWTLFHPSRDVATIQVVVDWRAARSPEGRAAFNAGASEVVRRHEKEWTRLVLTGIPAIRARYIESVAKDTNRLLPVAVLVILVILAITYRSPRVLVAALVTIAASVVWTLGFMGMVGIPLSVLTSFAPVIVMVISISDTVHIVTDIDDRMRAGAPRREAVAAGMADAAGPCLLTEVVVACGFLSLAFVNIAAILEFGLVTAAGMMLTWLANVTVLPLVLSAGPDPSSRARSLPAAGGGPDASAWAAGPDASSLFLRGFRRFVAWVEGRIVAEPRLVIGCAIAIVAVAGLAATRIRILSFVFDDLRPGSALDRDLRYAEEVHGGLVPLVVFLEPEADQVARSEGAPALEPEALRFLDRAEARLRAIPEARSVSGLASYLRKAHRIYAGEEKAREDGGLPQLRSLAVKEVDLMDDQRIFRDLLTGDRQCAAVTALLPDRGSPRVAALMAEMEAWAERERPQGYRVSVTGVMAIAAEISHILVDGLVQSFATAIAVSAVVFCIVLRSVRLAVIGLIPNVTPIVLMLAVMALLGIDLKPSTVLLFSMALTISDDDTIQYLSRFRRRTVDHGEDPARAALDVLRESALPMFVTATTVSAGFLVLTLSEFQGTANLGIIMGVTLFSAVFADVFVTPIMLRAWLGRRGGAPTRAAEKEEATP
jgi:hypothetical protein